VLRLNSLRLSLVHFLLDVPEYNLVGKHLRQVLRVVLREVLEADIEELLVDVEQYLTLVYIWTEILDVLAVQLEYLLALLFIYVDCLLLLRTFEHRGHHVQPFEFRRQSFKPYSPLMLLTKVLKQRLLNFTFDTI